MERHLHETIIKGDTPTFLNIIQENPDMIIHQRTAGSSNTVLHLATRFGHEEMAKEIVRLRPEMVLAVNKKMETPLYEACREGRVEMVKMFVETDPDVVFKVNKENETALFAACESGKIEVVSYLLDFPWFLIAEVDGTSTTSLHVAASGGYTEIVKEVLKARPEFAWKKDINGCIPLHLSCSKGHLEATRELLRFDADLSIIQDNEGRTPLHWAALKGRVSIIDEILSVTLQSADMLTKNGETVLHLGVKNNQQEAVKYLMETLINIESLPDRPDNDGNTVLHLATARRLSAMVIYLLKMGVDVNAINRKGKTALDVVESDVSHSGALLILPALQNAGAKRCDQLPPSTQHSRELQPIELDNPASTTSLHPKSPNRHHRRRHRRRRDKQLEIQAEGVRNARNTIIVVAVLIATVTFAAGINPPGGFDQKTGKSLLGSHGPFKVFLLCDIVALFLSLGTVIFLVSIIPFRRKSMMTLLAVSHKVMWLSMAFMAAAYIAAIWTVMPHGHGATWVLVALVAIGAGCTAAIFVGLGVLLTKHWIRKWEWRKRTENGKNDHSPSSSISRVEELQISKKGGRYSTSNSDVDSSDQGGYHLY